MRCESVTYIVTCIADCLKEHLTVLLEYNDLSISAIRHSKCVGTRKAGCKSWTAMCLFRTSLGYTTA